MMIENNKAGFQLGKFVPIELAWDNLVITAEIKVGKVPIIQYHQASVNKTLLNNLRGVMKPGHFTAILGPSGSGKTTMLNFLSGRLISDNLTISGDLILNSQ